MYSFYVFLNVGVDRSAVYLKINNLEDMELPNTESENWSIKVSIIYSDWQ